MRSFICLLLASSCFFTTSAAAQTASFFIKPSAGQASLAKRAPAKFVSLVAQEVHRPVSLVRPLALGWLLVESDQKGAEEFLEKLRKIAQVEAAEINAQRRAHRVPNDASFGSQWNLELIGAPAAWDIATGAERRIGIVDTGAASDHEDAPLDEEGFDFVTDPTNDNDDTEGRDSDYREPDVGCEVAEDDAGYHGAHVAGIAGARSDNGVGVAGVSFDAAIVHARVLDACSTGSDADILEGMAWLAGIDVPGVPLLAQAVDVINASLGGEGSCNAIYLDFMSAIDQRGVLVTASSGNEGNGFVVESPANCPTVISVGAEGPAGLAYYSNIDSTLDIIAPGGDQSEGDEEGILSLCGYSSDCYEYLEGTSMAAPHVAAAAALVRSVVPNATRREILFGMQMSGRTCAGCQNIAALDLEALLTLFDDAPPEVDPPLGEGECSLEFLCPSGQSCLVFDEGTACFLECQSDEECGSDVCTSLDFGDDGVASYCVACGEDCDEPDAGVPLPDGGSADVDPGDLDDEGCAQSRPAALSIFGFLLLFRRHRRVCVSS